MMPIQSLRCVHVCACVRACGVYVFYVVCEPAASNIQNNMIYPVDNFI